MSTIEEGVGKAQSHGAFQTCVFLICRASWEVPSVVRSLPTMERTSLRSNHQRGRNRDWGPPFIKDGTSAYFTGVNRNKRGIALDLTQPEARAVVLRLLEDTDVLIENSGLAPWKNGVWVTKTYYGAGFPD